MTPHELRRMRVELEKLAISGTLLSRAGRAISRSPMTTAAATGGAGALYGAATAGPGESRLGAALRGGVRGAVAGGAVGGLGRAYRDVRLLNPNMSATQAVKGTLSRMGRGIANFGKRQLHGFTGAYSKRPGDIGLRSSATSANKVHLEKLRALDELRHAKSPEAARKIRQDLRSRVKSLKEEGQRGDRALSAGITNLPGVVKGLATAPRRTSKAMWQELKGDGSLTSSIMGPGFAVGMPLVSTVQSVRKGDESDRGGLSVGQKLLKGGLTSASTIATWGLPIVPMVASSLGAETLSDKLIGKDAPAEGQPAAAKPAVPRAR